MSYQIPTSPDSSEPLDSTHATPATKLSVFSPEATRLSSGSSGRGIVRPRVPPPFDLQAPSNSQHHHNSLKESAVSSHHDPFTSGSPLTSTTTRSSSDPSKLSPTAATFTPASALESPAFTDELQLLSTKSSVRTPANQAIDMETQKSPTKVRQASLLELIGILLTYFARLTQRNYLAKRRHSARMYLACHALWVPFLRMMSLHVA